MDNVGFKNQIDFPKRLEMRPRISFDSNSQAENAKNSRKSYFMQDVRGPCTFTVQCVYSKPKSLDILMLTSKDIFMILFKKTAVLTITLICRR